jgi:hypothetical protein
MWELEPGGMLRLGFDRVRLADVAGYEAEEVRERDIGGRMTIALALMAVGILVAICVFQFGARGRYLIIPGFVMVFGWTSIVETFSTSVIRYARLRLVTSGGEEVVFTSSKVEDVAAIAGILDDAAA